MNVRKLFERVGSVLSMYNVVMDIFTHGDCIYRCDIYWEYINYVIVYGQVS